MTFILNCVKTSSQVAKFRVKTVLFTEFHINIVTFSSYIMWQ